MGEPNHHTAMSPWTKFIGIPALVFSIACFAYDLGRENAVKYYSHTACHQELHP